MKKYATMIILASSLGLASATLADDEKKKDRPAPGGEAKAERDGDARPRPDRPPGGPGADRRRPDGPPPGGPGGDRPGQRGGIADMLKGADTDGDKKISLKEWKAASLKRAEEGFKRLDGDEDGFITQEDIEKMRERFSGGRPGGNRPEGDRPPRGDRPGGPEGRGPREGGDDAAGGPKRPKRPEVE